MTIGELKLQIATDIYAHLVADRANDGCPQYYQEDAELAFEAAETFVKEYAKRHPHAVHSSGQVQP